MKNIKVVSFVLVLVLASISCSLFTPGISNYSNNVLGIDFEAPAQPINVTVQLDESSTVSEMISSNGGSISLTAADGSEFTLDFPANALETDTLITMTAVESIEGAPLDDGPVAAVQLEPSGLFFNEILTLTIVPAQEIPIENQIIFGYEGSGQDYHLAVIDPNSREIKVKLMQFSGAGVGSGGDKEWAANLMVQAGEASARLSHKVGELLQNERQAQLLGQEGNPEIWKSIKSYMEQYYDQVIQKEMAAAELDCKYAQKAIQSLLGLERQNQLLGLSADENGNIIPIVNDLWGKIDKLMKIGEKCRAAYQIVGGLDEFQTNTAVCDIMGPFTLTGGGFALKFSGGLSGTYTYSGGPFGASGSGSYTISLPNGLGQPGTMTGGGSGCVETELGTFCNSGTEKYSLSPLPEGSCP